VHIYTAHADATDNQLAKKVLINIANEERVHAGEFQRLLNILLKDEEGFLAQGAEEVNEMAKAGNAGATAAPLLSCESKKEGEPSKPTPTVGDLKR